MNTSIIVDRYARALLKYVQETGRGGAVCIQAERVQAAMVSLPELRRLLLSHDVVTDDEKIGLLRSSLDGAPEPELDRFFNLLAAKGRLGLTGEMLHRFVELYYRLVGVRRAYLKVVNQPSEEFMHKLSDLVRELTGDEAMIDVEIDPSIIGGFVFEIDDYLMDASVARQLELIRQQFIEKNRRIV